MKYNYLINYNDKKKNRNWWQCRIEIIVKLKTMSKASCLRQVLQLNSNANTYEKQSVKKTKLSKKKHPVTDLELLKDFD